MEESGNLRLGATNETIEGAYLEGCRARDHLTTLFEDDNGSTTHVAKTCCVCDTLIKFGDEKWIPIKKLCENNVVEFLAKESQCGSLYGQSPRVFERVRNSYTQKWFSDSVEEDPDGYVAILNSLVLSPRSYGRAMSGHGSKKELGCCSTCFGWVTNVTKKNSVVSEPPVNAIVNGLLIGSPPKELTELNPVELSIISLARPVGHIFCLTGGCHKQMKGWHNIYASDPGHTNRVLNFLSQPRGDIIDEEVVDDEEDVADGIQDLGNTSGETTRELASGDQTKDIAVILTGPFTARQKELARQKTKVRVEKVKAALRWLKTNNVLYKDVDVDEEVALPFVVDCSTNDISRNTNIENVFEMTATFVDQNEALNINGGFRSVEEFKAATLDRISTSNTERDLTLLHRSSTTRLKDYVGKNLLKAYPLQFPYGVGNLYNNHRERSGDKFYRHLLNLSRKEFHTPEFVLALHNVWERGRMVRQSFLKVSEDQRIDVAEMSDVELEVAVHNYLHKRSGNGVGDMFLRKISAITGSMAHTAAAARKARNNMFAMNSKFGLPCILFTITPDDHMNFRIKVMMEEFGKCKDPPSDNCTDHVLKEFVVRSAETRVGYPGLCAHDYENILRITIEIFLGWDCKKPEGQRNMKDKGLFGDLLGWCVATEEQGRKTLHGHFLLWVKDWNVALRRLRDQSQRATVKKVLKDFASSIMRAKLGSKETEEICNCTSTLPTVGSELPKCTEQDLRNLRTYDIPAEWGGKDIIKCPLCNKGFSGNDLVKGAVDKCLGTEPSATAREVDVFDVDALWFRESVRSRRKARMELYVMNEHVRQKKEDSIPPAKGSGRYDKLNFVTTALRNVHDCRHCSGCFKKDKCECRMKIPSRECRESQFLFDGEPREWYNWKGEPESTDLFFYEVERGFGDNYVNVHNETASIVFGCNTNIVSFVDGGSIMYITSYVAKNTQGDDRKAFVGAAMTMTDHLKKKKDAIAQNVLDENVDDEEAKLSSGIKVVIGASLAATKAYKCSATMAAFLTRNGSRFMFSHEFTYTNLDQFHESGKIENYLLDSNADGTPFLHSSVATYKDRGKEFDELCLYDACSKCFPKKRTLSEIREAEDSSDDEPNKPLVTLHRRKEGWEKIPVVTHMDFVNTKEFGGRNIFTCSDSECSDNELKAMEEYAKTASLLFLPFRQVSDLLSAEGTFLPGFRSAFWQGIISKEHQAILRNIQESHNSVNSGRPLDALERVTETPVVIQSVQVDGDEEDEEVDDEYMFESLITELDNLDEEEPFRNSDSMFVMETSIVRDTGANQCGRRLLCCPAMGRSVDGTTSAFRSTESHGSTSNERNRSNWTRSVAENKLRRRTLIRLHMECRVRRFEGDRRCLNVKPSGRVVNMKAYAAANNLDDDQTTAFVLITSAFVIELHRHLSNDGSDITVEMPLDATSQEMAGTTQEQGVVQPGGNSRVLRGSDCVRQLSRLHRRNVAPGQRFVGFLSGAGGTGKSKVIGTVLAYCKELCALAGVVFNKRTITVTALTGAAAVSIKGETTHSACVLNRAVTTEDIESWKDALMVIIDEVSFGSKQTLKNINEKLNVLKEQTHNERSVYGSIPIVFAGDFSQLEPVKGNPVWLDRDNTLWYDEVSTFMELKTNHRFRNDIEWGKLLQNLREKGCNDRELEIINSRVVKDSNQLSERDIPQDAVYATRTNKEKAAINDGLFARHLEMRHSRNKAEHTPEHTICIRASGMKFKSRKKNSYVECLSRKACDVVYAACGEGHVRDSNGKFYDPFLKLYLGRPLCINRNIDVPNCVANGALCTFRGVVLKDGIRKEDCVERALVDGYFVNCIDSYNVASVVVEMTDGDPGKIVYLQAEEIRAIAEFPWFWRGDFWKDCPRAKRRIKLSQFPVSVANARTVHKLQGRSIGNLVVSSWTNTGNWVYVVLSRCFTLGGLFLRKELKRTRAMSEKCREFHDHFRKHKRQKTTV